MDFIGKSSLWVERYRPRTVKDLILPKKYKQMFENIVAGGECPNLLLAGSAGLGKTSAAQVLAHEMSSDFLSINASMENSIDTLRYKVNQFAMTSSFADGKKLCLLDEADRLTPNAMDSLKGIIEQTEANCRFIITTNNLSKIIDPIKSRTQLIDFSFTQTDTKEIIVQYFKRCCFILDTEKVEYDKKVLAEFIQKIYPDFRKIINELQKAASMFGKIDENVYKVMDDAIVTDLINDLKAKKFLSVQKTAGLMDPNAFYPEFYKQINEVLDPKCIPDIVLILGEGAYRNGISTDKEINLLATLVQIMKAGVWR